MPDELIIQGGQHYFIRRGVLYRGHKSKLPLFTCEDGAFLGRKIPGNPEQKLIELAWTQRLESLAGRTANTYCQQGSWGYACNTMAASLRSRGVGLDRKGNGYRPGDPLLTKTWPQATYRMARMLWNKRNRLLQDPWKKVFMSIAKNQQRRFDECCRKNVVRRTSQA